MSKIKAEQIEYKNFGKCLRITNGKIEAVVTLDVGPRILRFAFVGGENFFHEDIDRESCTCGEPLEAVFGKGSKWFIYGGHRLWLSPEDMPMTYYPDNEPVNYNIIDGGVELIPPAQRVNDVQYRIQFIMSEDKPQATVNHFITNVGGSTIKRAPWAITVMRRGGMEVIPEPINNTGLLANRVLSLWPYSDMSDDRIYWGKKYITMRQDTSVSSAFKFGINNNRGWAAYFVNNGMFLKRYNHNQSGNYPDNGVSFETFTNNQILEMETLGELVDITPGGTAFHSEEWTLIDNVECPAPNDEVTLDTLVKLYIEK
ncbi:MAG: hypothetical protein DIU81_006550 [[Clostridium] cellulosi]|nr:MAG: hypothetical protein DIU81_02260 [[Clostridium] cellulosi]